MNFEDLQEAWANEKLEGSSLPKESLDRERSFSAVSRIRRNMRAEFIATLGGYLVVLLILWKVSTSSLSVFAAGLSVFVLMVQSLYYFLRFYVFYRVVNRYDLGVRKNIRRIVYELELNIEIYRTYSFCAVPLATLAWIALLGGGVIDRFVGQAAVNGSLAGTHLFFYICILVLVSQFITAFFLKLHIRLQYGRYLAELKKLADDLEVEEL